MVDHPKIPHRTKSEASKLSHVQGTETVHHEKRKSPKPKGVPDLNLTSMMDVCFQLLIFFVLTASFAVGEGVLPAEMPQGQGKQADTEDPPKGQLKIYLRSLGGDDVSIQIDGAAPPTNFKELYATLSSLQNNAAHPTAPYNSDDSVIIKPDGTVKWKDVVNTFNAAIKAKYNNVNFAQPN